MIRFFAASALAKRSLRAESTGDVIRWLRSAAALSRVRADLERPHVVDVVPSVVASVHALRVLPGRGRIRSPS